MESRGEQERPNIFEALTVAAGDSLVDEGLSQTVDAAAASDTEEGLVSGDDETSEEEPPAPADSDTPSEESDMSGEEEERGEDDQTATTFTGETAKDGTKWNRNPNPNQARTLARNVFRASGNQAVGCQHANSPRDAYRLFVTYKMISDIVKFTNIQGSQILKEKWKPMDMVECEGLLGMLLFLGTRKQSFVNTETLWDSVYGFPMIRGCMSRRRFQLLMTHLRFDDKTTRTARRQRDIFAPFRDIWDEFMKNLSQHYVPGCFLTVDEQLVPFRGHGSFLQYLPSKPDKYGIKVFWVADAQNNFPLKGIPYLGRAAGQQRAVNLGRNVATDLVTPFFKSGRNVTCDNFFTDTVLTETLLKNGLTTVGTVRQNKGFLPNSFKSKARLPVHDSRFMYKKDHTIVQYQSKKNKQVVLISTMHDTGVVESTPANTKRKPEMVLFYNDTKGAVDSLDKMAHAFTTKRRTQRWPMIMFFNILDLANIAARVIWKLHFPEHKLSKDDERAPFIRAISEELSFPQMKRRLATVTLPRSLHETVQKVIHNLEAKLAPPEDTRKGHKTQKASGSGQKQALSQEGASSSESALKRKRCLFCSWKRDRKTQQRCSKCSEFICTEHTHKVCPSCIISVKSD